MKVKCFEKWSKFQHGIGYWLGAVRATSHCLNQCWHSSSTHIYVNRCDSESSIMPLYDHDDRTTTETDMSSRWLPRLSLGRWSLPSAPPVMAGAVTLATYPFHIYFIQCLTHWGWDKMAAFLADDTLKCIFLNGNSWIPNKISWKYVA